MEPLKKLHEETWTEAVVEFVEEHHPSEWCDYSHCWKCEEETTCSESEVTR